MFTCLVTVQFLFSLDGAMLSFQQLADVPWHFLPSGFLFLLSSCFFNSGSLFVCVASLLICIAFFYCGYLSKLKVETKGKAVLITGCDTGFGHDLALKLHNIGFQVIATCVNDGSDGAIRLKTARGNGRIHVLKMDVTRDKDIEDAKQYVLNNLNNNVLWGIVNNAGISFGGGFVEAVPFELFEKAAAVNLFGVVRVTKAFLPMLRKNKGRIVNVSSLISRFTMPASSDYAITKLGVEAFSNCLRREMRQFGVKVCIIQPGNFMSTTSILGQPGSKYSMRYFWSMMNEDAKKDYGLKTEEWQEKLVEFGKAHSFPTTAPCVDAMIDALSRVHPKTHYFVARLQDKLAVYFAESLPVWMADKFYEVIMHARVSYWENGEKINWNFRLLQ